MVFIRRDYCNNHPCGTKNMRRAVKLTLFRTLIGSSLLLVACALSACGKTGELYLPDSNNNPAATPTKTDTPTSPGKTQ
jgi:predicted small lipoprotein YifL